MEKIEKNSKNLEKNGGCITVDMTGQKKDLVIENLDRIRKSEPQGNKCQIKAAASISEVPENDHLKSNCQIKVSSGAF